jgi:hypothetical protein
LHDPTPFEAISNFKQASRRIAAARLCGCKFPAINIHRGRAGKPSAWLVLELVPIAKVVIRVLKGHAPR